MNSCLGKRKKQVVIDETKNSSITIFENHNQNDVLTEEQQNVVTINNITARIMKQFHVEQLKEAFARDDIDKFIQLFESARLTYLDERDLVFYIQNHVEQHFREDYVNYILANGDSLTFGKKLCYLKVKI